MLHAELSPFDSVADPEETYIHALGPLRIDGIRGKSFGNRVIYHDGCGELRVSLGPLRIDGIRGKSFGNRVTYHDGCGELRVPEFKQQAGCCENLLLSARS